MDRLISLQAAIDLIRSMESDATSHGISPRLTPSHVINGIESLPSAQPEIIRCKDCKYQDENWRRVSVRWLPCMDVRTGSNWFCGSAESTRRSDDL